MNTNQKLFAGIATYIAMSIAWTSPATCFIVAVRTVIFSQTSGGSLFAIVAVPYITSLVVFFCCITLTYALQYHLGYVNLHHLNQALIELDGDYTIEEHPLSSYVDIQSARTAATSIIYRLKPNSRQVGLIGSLKAYLDPTNVGYIFLTEPPNTNNKVQRFFIYHEIGHLTPSSYLLSLHQHRVHYRVALSYVPCVFLLNSLWPQLCVVVLWLIVWFVDSYEDSAEISADFFAIGRLLALDGPEYTLQTIKAVSTAYEDTLGDPTEDQVDYVRRLASRIRMINLYKDKVKENDQNFFRPNHARIDKMVLPFSIHRAVATVAIFIMAVIWPKQIKTPFFELFLACALLIICAQFRCFTLHYIEQVKLIRWQKQNSLTPMKL